MNFARDGDASSIERRGDAFATRVRRKPRDRRPGPARHPGTLEQGLCIEHPVVALDAQRALDRSNLAPGSGLPRGLAPAPQRYAMHAPDVPTHCRNRSEGLLDQPVDLHPRKPHGQVARQWQCMDDIAHGGCLDDQDPHGAGLCRTGRPPEDVERPRLVAIAVRVGALPAPSVFAGLLDCARRLPTEHGSGASDVGPAGRDVTCAPRPDGVRD